MTLIEFRFSHVTWQSMIAEHAKGLCEHHEKERQQRLAREKQQEQAMIGAAVILGPLIASGISAFLYIKNYVVSRTLRREGVNTRPARPHHVVRSWTTVIGFDFGSTRHLRTSQNTRGNHDHKEHLRCRANHAQR